MDVAGVVAVVDDNAPAQEATISTRIASATRGSNENLPPV